MLNVGAAHVGEFGSRENTARAKAELVEALGPDGVAVLNADDAVVAAMAGHAAAGSCWSASHPRRASARLTSRWTAAAVARRSG